MSYYALINVGVRLFINVYLLKQMDVEDLLCNIHMHLALCSTVGLLWLNKIIRIMSLEIHIFIL